jgi:hypothetical protein
MKFAQMRDVFVCDLVVDIKVCQGDVHGHVLNIVIKLSSLLQTIPKPSNYF